MQKEESQYGKRRPSWENLSVHLNSAVYCQILQKLDSLVHVSFWRKPCVKTRTGSRNESLTAAISQLLSGISALI